MNETRSRTLEYVIKDVYNKPFPGSEPDGWGICNLKFYCSIQAADKPF
jgi:hypothetical protein